MKIRFDRMSAKFYRASKRFECILRVSCFVSSVCYCLWELRAVHLFSSESEGCFGWFSGMLVRPRNCYGPIGCMEGDRSGSRRCFSILEPFQAAQTRPWMNEVQYVMILMLSSDDKPLSRDPLWYRERRFGPQRRFSLELGECV